jgi:hypothetical protein
MEATGKNFVKQILSSFQLYLLHIPSLKDKPLRIIKCQSPDAKHFKKMLKKIILVLRPLSFGGRKIYKLRFWRCAVW